MFGLISPKVYGFVALITAGILYGINWLDGGFQGTGSVVSFLSDQAAGSGLGAAAFKLVTRPIEFTVSNEFGAIVGGLLWPLAVLWLFMLVFLIILSFLGPFVKEVTCSISGC